MKSILDKSFRYVRSDKTDLKATFARIRRQLQANQIEAQAKVKPLNKERKLA